MRSISSIIVHCSATPAGRDVSATQIDTCHRARGFNQIGYHFVIRLDGSVEIGRPLEIVGAHCKGHNASSIGVCYIGGLDPDTMTPADTRTPQQRRALRKLLADLHARFPGSKIFSHRDFAPKACPCFDATAEYADISNL